MDIKIRFTKKMILILGGLVFCGLIGFGWWDNSTLKARQEVKASCQDNCACFENVVDYRLTNEQVRLFARFMKELQKRKNASVLEFMDTLAAVEIQRAFSVCQPQAVKAAEAPQPSEQNIQAKNKK